MSMMPEAVELPWLWAGLSAYALATYAAFRGVSVGYSAGAAVNRTYERRVMLWVLAGAALLAMALAQRWVRVGHGPFVNLFELLMSQLFSLGVVFSVAYWRVPVLRPSAVVALPLVWILGVWVLLLDPVATAYPPTYYNPWLWVHVGFGKVFLGLCLVAASLGGVLLLRGTRRGAHWLRTLPPDEVLDNYAWRFILLAFVFHSTMLIAGAVWAQDAWGRYWSWDALETSSFLTWLTMAAGLHARLTYRIPIRVGAVCIAIVFILAFMTYFGTPFYSEAAHKGVI